MSPAKIIEQAPAGNKILKKRIKPFYTLIIDRDVEDHRQLHCMLKGMIPNILIESLYDEEEAIAYFANCKRSPDLIFLDMNLHTIFLKFALYTIRKTKLLYRAPVAILNSSQIQKNRDELKVFGVNEFYLELRRKIDLKLISYDIRKRWLVA